MASLSRLKGETKRADQVQQRSVCEGKCIHAHGAHDIEHVRQLRERKTVHDGVKHRMKGVGREWNRLPDHHILHTLNHVHARAVFQKSVV